MELALLVYVIGLISPIHAILLTIIFLTGGVFSVSLISKLSAFAAYEHESYHAKVNYYLKRSGWILLALVLFNTAIPSEKTAYTMVGAYTAQKIATSEKANEVGTKVYTIINQKLDGYIEKGIKEAEKAVEKEAKKHSK
jgi:hypothetical protein